MDDRPDYYRILHVAPDAPEEIIKASYRTLMQRLRQHPDLGGDHETAAVINEAYAALTDPQKRAEYDRKRKLGRRSSEPASTTGKTPPPKGEYGETSRVLIGACLFCRTPHEHGLNIPKDMLCAVCESPLSTAERHQLEDSGLRALSRIPRQQPIAFYSSWPSSQPHSGESRDISLDGMQFVTPQALREGEVIKIDCAVCRAVARVAHVHESGNAWVVGVEFVTLRFENVQGTFVSAQA